MTRWRKPIKIAALATITCLLGIFVFTPADAQRGPGERGGPRDIDPERMKQNWSLQAESAASMLELDEETSNELREAYLSARQKLQDEMMKERESGGGWEKFRDMRETATADFEKSVASSLDAEKAQEAFAVLGGFSFRTDMGTARLAEVVEDQERLEKAVVIFLKSFGGERRGPGDEGREDQRARIEEGFTQLGEVLSETEMAEFRESLERFGRRGPRGPRRE